MELMPEQLRPGHVFAVHVCDDEGTLAVVDPAHPDAVAFQVAALPVWMMHAGRRSRNGRGRRYMYWAYRIRGIVGGLDVRMSIMPGAAVSAVDSLYEWPLLAMAEVSAA